MAGLKQIELIRQPRPFSLLSAPIIGDQVDYASKEVAIFSGDFAYLMDPLSDQLYLVRQVWLIDGIFQLQAAAGKNEYGKSLKFSLH